MKRIFSTYLEYDIEYDGYIADVPSLPGCMSQGKTKQEAIANIKNAIREYVAVLKQQGEKTLPVEDFGITQVQVAL